MQKIGNFLDNLERGDKQRVGDCDRHGEYISRLYLTRTWTGCPRCTEEAYSRQYESLEASRRDEAMDRWREVLGDSGIPSAYEHCTIIGFQALCPNSSRVMEQVEAYAADLGATVRAGKNLVLVGWTGTGKTHILSAVTLQALREGRSAIFITASKVFRAVRDTWGRGNTQTEADVFRALAAVDVLCIDEIQEMDEKERRVINDAINDRYEKGKPVCISSNLGKEAFARHIGGRALDRLIDRGSTVCIMEWESFRSGARW
jgi:DNA replication protein DnaC